MSLLNGDTTVDADGNKYSLPDAVVDVAGSDHGRSGHGQYDIRMKRLQEAFKTASGVNPSGLSAQDAFEYASALVNEIDNTSDPYIKQFNQLVGSKASPAALKKFGKDYQTKVLASTIPDVWYKADGSALSGRMRVPKGKLPKWLPYVGTIATIVAFPGQVQSQGWEQATRNTVESSINPLGFSQQDFDVWAAKSYSDYWQAAENYRGIIPDYNEYKQDFEK